MAKEINIKSGIDWTTVLLYFILIFIGWINIYAAIYNPEEPISIFSLSHQAGRQLMFLGGSMFIILLIIFIDVKVYETFAYVLLAFMALVLIATIFLGADIKGSHSWIKIGSFSIQPAEIAKTVTALALAKYLSTLPVNNNSLNNNKNLLYALLIIAIPPIIIILQNETGSALAFAAFIIVLYREGLPGIYPGLILVFITLFILALIFPKGQIIAGLALLGLIIYRFFLPKGDRTSSTLFKIGSIFLLLSIFIFGIDFFVNKVLQPHQQNRIKVLVNPKIDPLGVGWNVTQSGIAISSGGLSGKGFLQGTHTKFNYVPEQATDFIFCTIGEEWGFVGGFVVIVIYLLLLYRIIFLAEKQRDSFARVYGYCVASIITFHLLVNIGMTIGLMPIIGIPLPLISYGGSSLWSFTILLFIFLKLNAHRSFKS